MTVTAFDRRIQVVDYFPRTRGVSTLSSVSVIGVLIAVLDALGVPAAADGKDIEAQRSQLCRCRLMLSTSPAGQ